MSEQAAKLIEAASKLSEADRIEIATRSMQGLSEADEKVIEKLWIEEANRRIERLRTGETYSIPWEEAQKTLWQKS